MAIGSVVDLIDYKEKTIEIAKKYGGGGGGGTGDVSRETIAPEWSSNQTYHYGDMVWYQNKLYACKLDEVPTTTPALTPIDNVTEWYQDIDVDFVNSKNIRNENNYIKAKEIAPEYDSTSTTIISEGSYRYHKTYEPSTGIYENELFKSLYTIKRQAGEFNNSLWDSIDAWSSSETYNEGDYAVYPSYLASEYSVYRCDEANTTGEWDSSKWTDCDIDFELYNSSSKNYTANYSKVKTGGVYYIAGQYYYNTGTLGEWNAGQWIRINACNEIWNRTNTELTVLKKKYILDFEEYILNYGTLPGMKVSNEWAFPADAFIDVSTGERLFSMNYITQGAIVECPSNGCTYITKNTFYAAGGYTTLKLLNRNPIKVWRNGLSDIFESQGSNGFIKTKYNFGGLKILGIDVYGGYNVNSGELFIPTTIKDTNNNIRKALAVYGTDLQSISSPYLGSGVMSYCFDGEGSSTMFMGNITPIIIDDETFEKTIPTSY